MGRDAGAATRGLWRSRWAAIGAAVAVAIGGGGVWLTSAATPTATTVYVGITPCRLVDTRPATTVGGRSTPIAAGETATFTVWGAQGNCNVPSSAVAVVFNLTAANGTAQSFFTLFPADASKPTASNLNWKAAQNPIANSATVPLSADGKVKLFNNVGTVDAVIDIVGYYRENLPITPMPLNATVVLTTPSSRSFSPLGASSGVNDNVRGQVAWIAPRDCTLTDIEVTIYGKPTAGSFKLGYATMNSADGPIASVLGPTIDSSAGSISTYTLPDLAIGETQRLTVVMLALSGLTQPATPPIGYLTAVCR